MKLSKDELKQKIAEKITDEDLQIELLEDVEDSFDVPQETDTSELDDLKAKYDDLKTKYKERFLKGDETKEEPKDEGEEVEEPTEEEKVEEKDIFKTLYNEKE